MLFIYLTTSTENVTFNITEIFNTNTAQESQLAGVMKRNASDNSYKDSDYKQL